MRSRKSLRSELIVLTAAFKSSTGGAAAAIEIGSHTTHQIALPLKALLADPPGLGSQ